MYNGQIINLLLKERNLRAKDLLEFLQIQTNGSITSIVKGNPTAERLEKIADFLEVPIDSLFKRSKKYSCDAVENPTGTTICELLEKTKALETMIEEKDKRLALLEDMVAILKQQLGNQK